MTLPLGPVPDCEIGSEPGKQFRFGFTQHWDGQTHPLTPGPDLKATVLR